MGKRKVENQGSMTCFLCEKKIQGIDVCNVMKHIADTHLKAEKAGQMSLKCLRLYCRKKVHLMDDSDSELRKKALQLVEHQIRVHKDSKPAYLPVHSCNQCRFWTYSHDTLKNHLQSHGKTDENCAEEIVYIDDVSLTDNAVYVLEKSEEPPTKVVILPNSEDKTSSANIASQVITIADTGDRNKKSNTDPVLSAEEIPQSLKIKNNNATTEKSFECFLCQHKPCFRTYDSLRAHFVERHFVVDGKRQTLPCPQCGDMYTALVRSDKHLILSLAQHMEDRHQMEPPDFLSLYLITCSECSWWTLDKSLQHQHEQTHIDGDVMKTLDLYKCCFCVYEAATWNEFRDHFKQDHVTMSDMNTYCVACPTCSLAISMDTQLVTWGTLLVKTIAHMMGAHQHPQPDYVTKYTCNPCDYTTLLKKSFLGHQRYHDRTDKDKQENGSAGKRYECFVCDEPTYAWNKLLQHFKEKHFKLHCGEKYGLMFQSLILSCHICEMTLNFTVKKHMAYGVYITRLVQHILEKHKTVKPDYITTYACEKCSYTTVVQDNMRSHKSQHKNIKKSCEHCGVSLSPSGLWRHLKVCPALGPAEHHLLCPHCNASFSQDFKLKDHINRVHFEWFRHQCNKCQRTYFRKDHYLNHLYQSHGENPEDREVITCANCSFVTLYNSTMTEHVKRVHTLGTFPCKKCGSVFSKYNSLNKHSCKEKKSCGSTLPMVTPPENEDNSTCFQCQLCEYSTTFKICMQVHLQTMHPSHWRQVKDSATSGGLTADPGNDVMVTGHIDQELVEEEGLEAGEILLMLSDHEDMNQLDLDDGQVFYQIVIAPEDNPDNLVGESMVLENAD